MRRYQRLWRRKARMRCLGVRLDDRREIRAGIGEQVFDAALREQRQIGLRDAPGLEFLPAHATFSPLGAIDRIVGSRQWPEAKRKKGWPGNCTSPMTPSGPQSGIGR